MGEEEVGGGGEVLSDPQEAVSLESPRPPPLTQPGGSGGSRYRCHNTPRPRRSAVGYLTGFVETAPTGRLACFFFRS